MKKIFLKIIYKILGKVPEDVNDDGKVSAEDYIAIKNYIMNKDGDK